MDLMEWIAASTYHSHHEAVEDQQHIEYQIPEEVGHIHMSFTIDCIFNLAFHMGLNSCNTKLKNGGDRWGLLHTWIALHVSFQATYFVL